MENLTAPTRPGTRRFLGVCLLAAGVILAGIASLALGARFMSLSDLITAIRPAWEALHTRTTGGSDGEVIAMLRVPRTVISLCAGAALGVSGALIQGHTRNPLADPGILGVTSGAAFAVVFGFTFLSVESTSATAIAAFIGALAAAAAVFGIAAMGRGSVNPLSLILAGAALSALLGSMTTALVLADARTMDRIRFWTVGSVARATLDTAWVLGPIMLIFVAIALSTGPTLNALALGEESASGLGVNVTRARIIGLVLISLLAGTATAAAGPIAFVGLVVPHIARTFTGPDNRWILPLSALAGALMLTIADVLGRIILSSGELEVGIVLAFIGGPFFIAFVRRKRLLSL
ncbi:FecCD family ABC transporter permease [Corynebacterium spheniscorum]|uniref:Iron complex transport system permease protein n=1 Tax=Corynebacterium spheniscorum TaxID=185761 RepID=A0A1I2SCT8_9CORY|nr:iron ABC transporter permease [Corynebacterium spheniscorum]KAA8723960.1 iron ABC transporter permease [Corynebacterium spheniscorum]SFG50638.1 iron complex transport system permease protein [Corynebacterium spheniscorum]